MILRAIPGPPRVNAGELMFDQTGRPNAVPGAVVTGTPTRPAMPVLLTRYVTWMAYVPSLRTEAPGQEGERSSPDPDDSLADSTTCAGLIPRGFCNRTVASARPRQVDDLAAAAVLPGRRAFP